MNKEKLEAKIGKQVVDSCELIGRTWVSMDHSRFKRRNYFLRVSFYDHKKALSVDMVTDEKNIFEEFNVIENISREDAEELFEQRRTYSTTNNALGIILDCTAHITLLPAMVDSWNRLSIEKKMYNRGAILYSRKAVPKLAEIYALN
ncbi:hypothetical protein HOK51_01690 [Candidatus Woesearchaeota archaeon]|jgi:hypothetical protein|nr:hypothetical protein [Candidatus Woesearchaeota archaeon]MBT6518527.1 hypothetical protein [Candidatus Woesearchaeota archaeon]MBT7368399.1 hypothetical protein [Candidatus Woesearchaeota archaeon]